MNYWEKRNTMMWASEKLLKQQKEIEDLQKELSIHNHYMRLIRNIEMPGDRIAIGQNHIYTVAKDLEYMAHTLERTDTDPLPVNHGEEGVGMFV